MVGGGGIVCRVLDIGMKMLNTYHVRFGGDVSDRRNGKTRGKTRLTWRPYAGPPPASCRQQPVRAPQQQPVVRRAVDRCRLTLNSPMSIGPRGWAGGGVVGLAGSGGAGAANRARSSCFLTMLTPVVTGSLARRQGVRQRKDRGVNSDDGKTLCVF